ncbi:MAG: hypothetical protein RMJ53_08630 [Chitinophagales bacterium]|nr:hypothetical protein [Chitinophagales bacterium]
MFSSAFDIENRAFERRKQLYSILVTLLVHSLLLLLLYLATLHLPNPPYTDNEGGMSVNFGLSETGSGDEQAFTYTPVASVPEPVAAPSAPVESRDENIVTQDLEEAPAVVTKETKPRTINSKPSPTPAATKPTSSQNTVAPPMPKPDENALFRPGAYGKPNQSSGDGTGGAAGDQGKAEGDPFANNYDGSGSGWGTGSGDGIGDGNVRLAGRKLRYKPEVTERSQAKGKVVIQIKVDRSGKVVEARYTQAGSTTADEQLIKTSVEAAYKYRFDENPQAADLQIGTITFIYKVH